MRIDLDVLVFGGGCAGLWLLDALRRSGYRALLLESHALGGGQTGMAQGILHSGLKYLLSGQSSPAAAFTAVQDQWRQSLRGEAEPDLRTLRMRADCCYLWRTDSVRSRLGLAAAKHGLRTRPVPVAPADRPAALVQCPGTVYRLDEPVIDPRDFVRILSQRNVGLIWQSAGQPDGFQLSRQGSVESVAVAQPGSDCVVELAPRFVVLAAGEGNAALRQQLGLPAEAMQRRPLHVLYLAGSLPSLNGHCIDGAGTRVTVTSDQASDGRKVWQLGGRISEEGVQLDEAALIERGQSELRATLPGVSLADCAWFARRVNRAEASTRNRGLPHGAQLLRDGNVLTVWPTKLVLTPTVPDLVLPLLGAVDDQAMPSFLAQIADLAWPAPPVAVAAWEDPASWKRAA